MGPLCVEPPGQLCMPAVVIDVRAADDPRDVVHDAVQAVAEGKLVVFPTETIYGVAARALDPQAVARLSEVKGRKPNQPFTLAIKSVDEAWDFAPDMSLLAERLARRCWPGPITLVVDASHSESAVRQLSAEVQEAVCPAGTVGLRVPGHNVILDVMRMVAGPLVLTSANRGGAASRDQRRRGGGGPRRRRWRWFWTTGPAVLGSRRPWFA